jgi:hypothetical protein
MNIIKEINRDGNEIEIVIIDRGNEEYTSMPKAEYDRQQAEQSTPSVEGIN